MGGCVGIHNKLLENKVLSCCQVCDWSISGSTYRGLWLLSSCRGSMAEYWQHKSGAPGFDSRRLPAFSLSSIFASKHLNSLDSNVNSKPSETLDHSGSKCQIVAVHF